MGTSFIAYKATVAVSGIVMLAPASLLDGEWQTDALPITGGSPGALMDGEWQTDALPIVMSSPDYMYDVYASSLSLENRWRLNTNLSTNGNTEASIGTLSTAVIVDVTSGNLDLTGGVTNRTSDAQSQSKTNGRGTVLWAAPAGAIPSTFTVGMWYQASTANAGLDQCFFCVGASPAYTGTYHGVEVYVAGSGAVVVQFGDATSAVSSGRITYVTAAGAITGAGAPVFIVVRAAKATTLGAISFDLLINGVVVACPNQGSGGATTVVWGDRLTIGSGFWGRFYQTMYDPFDEPFFTSGYLTTPQILQLYNYGKP